MSPSETYESWNKLTVSALKKELETRKASVKTLSPKEQLINRLIRIDSGTALDDDTIPEVPLGTPPQHIPSQPISDYGLLEDEDVDALPVAQSVAQTDEFGIDSDDDAFVELAIKVESPNLKRNADGGTQSPSKRQCKVEGKPRSGTSELILSLISRLQSHRHQLILRHLLSRAIR